MNKQIFLDFIEKYELDGLAESVAWESSDGILQARMVSEDKTLLGDVAVKGFDSTIFQGHKLGFWDTARLVKMFGVLDDSINISLMMVGEKPIAINFSDEKGIKEKYALSDLVTIPTVPALKYVPPEFEITIKLTDDFANTFVKAKNALEVSAFTIYATPKKVYISFGQTNINTHNITFDVDGESSITSDGISFDAEKFKRVLLANKGIEGQFRVSKEGISTIEYKNDAYTAKYFLVATNKK